jgi:hypothetical protein
MKVSTAEIDAWGCEDILLTDMDGSNTLYFADGSAFFDQPHQLTGAPLPALF